MDGHPRQDPAYGLLQKGPSVQLDEGPFHYLTRAPRGRRWSSRSAAPQSEALGVMAAGRRPHVRASTIRTLDAAVVVWIVLWILLGIFVGRAIWGVGAIADPVIRNADGLSQTAAGFDRLRSVPLIGGVMGGAVEGVGGTADKARAEAQGVKDKVRAAGVVIGCLVALGPALLALLIYLPRAAALAA